MSPDVVAGPGRLWVQNDSFFQVRSVRPHPRGSTDCEKPGTGKQNRRPVGQQHGGRRPRPGPVVCE
jgi:hypothetical protein